jgi:protein ImuA
MSGRLSRSPGEVRDRIQELRRHHGLFSFQNDVSTGDFSRKHGLSPELGVRAGGIIEWLVAREGAGAVTSALHLMAHSCGARGVWAVVDPERECYVAAFSGWGIDSSRILVLRPETFQETSWAIEQCLRCPGVSATWAWVGERTPARVHRRWQLAAEAGGGVGLVFRPIGARRQPAWADLRLLVTPRAGGQGETRRLHIEVLYCRGGNGGIAQAWEIDHAAGLVRLVPQVADPASAKRAARA